MCNSHSQYRSENLHNKLPMCRGSFRLRAIQLSAIGDFHNLHGRVVTWIKVGKGSYVHQVWNQSETSKKGQEATKINRANSLDLSWLFWPAIEARLIVMVDGFFLSFSDLQKVWPPLVSLVAYWFASYLEHDTMGRPAPKRENNEHDNLSNVLNWNELVPGADPACGFFAFFDQAWVSAQRHASSIILVTWPPRNLSPQNPLVGHLWVEASPLLLPGVFC